MSKYLSHSKLATLESVGIHLIDSNYFNGVQYNIDGVGLTIYARKCGRLQVNWDRLDELIEELREFKEVYGT